VGKKKRDRRAEHWGGGGLFGKPGEIDFGAGEERKEKSSRKYNPQIETTNREGKKIMGRPM